MRLCWAGPNGAYTPESNVQVKTRIHRIHRQERRCCPKSTYDGCTGTIPCKCNKRTLRPSDQDDSESNGEKGQEPRRRQNPLKCPTKSWQLTHPVVSIIVIEWDEECEASQQPCQEGNCEDNWNSHLACYGVTFIKRLDSTTGTEPPRRCDVNRKNRN